MGKRTATALGVAVVLGAAAVLVALIAAGREGTGPSGRAGPDEATTTTAATPTSTSTTLFAEGQGPVVAVNAAGQVVLLDADSGATRFVLLEGVDVTDPAKNGIAISPVEGAAYVVKPGSSAITAEIVRVPLSKEEAPDVVTTGLAPAVSPDGASLAYVRYVGEGTGATPTLIVRDLKTGGEKVLPTPEGERGFAFIPDLAWAPTGRVVVFTAGEVQTGLYAIDVKKAATLGDATRLGPPVDEAAERSWFTVTQLGARLAVGERQGGVPGRAHRILEVDLQGQVRGTVRDAPGPFFRLDSRTGGGLLLYVVDSGPDGGRLMRLRPGEEPTELAAGIVVATW